MEIVKTVTEDVQADVDLAHKTAKESSFPHDATTKVGCVITAGDGRRFPGANIKRAAWNGTTCAERMAVDQAIFHGITSIERVVIYAETSRNFEGPLWLTGEGRELLAELLVELGQADVAIYAVARNQEIAKSSLTELLPQPVSGSLLKTS